MQLNLLAALGSALLTIAPPPSGSVLPPALPAQDAAAEAARLLPADTVFLLRIESAEGLLALVNEMAAAAGESPLSAAEMLADLNLPGDPGQVDTSRPLWLAVALSAQVPEGEPKLTFVVPAKELEAYQGSVADERGWTSAVSGGYVGVSQAAGYAASEAPSALAASLRPGMLSMHLDLETLISTFRPFIEMGLDQAETQLDTLAQMAEGPIDIGPLLEMYVDLAWDFVDSAQALDVALAQQGGSLELSGWLTTLEKSPMAAWGEGAPVDLSGWPAQVDPAATVSMALGGDWAAMMKRMQPLLEASFSIYAEEASGFMKEYLAASERLLPLMGPAFIGGDLGSGGMRMGYVVRSEKPAQLLEGMAAVAQGFTGGAGTLGIGVSAPQNVEVGGVKAVRYRMEIDLEDLSASMGEELGEAERARMRDAMAALYGADGLTITLAPVGQALVAAFGGGDEFAQRVLTAPAGAARGVPADLQRALAEASGGSMALVYRFDLGKLVEEIGALAAALSGSQADFGALPTSSMPITIWGSIGGRTWSGGTILGLDVLSSLVEALAASNPDDEALDGVLAPTDSRAAVVQAEMAMIEAALELFAVNNAGRYPDALELLTVRDEHGEAYLEKLPSDPWGHPYLYGPPTEAQPTWRLICTGADGALGGTGPAADIVLSGEDR